MAEEPVTPNPERHELERHYRIKSLFLRLCDLKPEQRRAVMDVECRDESERLELESLFGHYDSGTITWGRGDDSPAARIIFGASREVPERIGRYRIIRLIGRGGMGAVYEAEQDEPRRLVALKVINPGAISPENIRRFKQEVEFLGRLEHEGIARIYDAGTSDSGAGAQPYFSMEFVRGEPLTTHATGRNLDIHQRLLLIAKICKAVDYAHANGVIHRDLKPWNILVTDDDQPKILDFGVARIADADMEQTWLKAEIGKIIGTIPYMSPEQTEGDPEKLDKRSDVYALGVVAYELLAGCLPYDLEGKALQEALRVIREDNPIPLSSINRSAGDDPHIIVHYALRKEPERRFQSAQDMASEIERFLRKEPLIIARPPSRWYEASMFARRNRALVGGVAATFAMLLIGLVASFYVLNMANVARASESKALASERQRAHDLDQIASFQAEQLSSIDATTMGLRLRTDLLSRKREYLLQAKHDKAEIAESMTEFEKSLAGVNFTDAALRTLDENIFDRALTAIERQFADQPQVKATLLQTLADTMSTLGLLDDATAPQAEALEIRIRVLGENHRATLESFNRMGVLLIERGKPTDAEILIAKALPICRRVLGENDLETLAAVSNMGSILADQGKPDEAAPYYRLAAEKRLQLQGERNNETLAAQSNLARFLQSIGQDDEAEPIFQNVLNVRRQILGDDDPETLISMSNLAVLLRSQQRFDKAETLLTEAFATQRRILGDEHKSTLTTMNNLGSVFLSQGKLDEAEDIFQLALDARRRVLGDDHHETISSISNMGVLLLKYRSVEEAEPYLREALERRTHVLGQDHPQTLASMNVMAAMLLQTKRPGEALEMLAPRETDFRSAFAETNPRLLASFLMNLGKGRAELGEYAEAESNLLEAHTILLQTTGPMQRDNRDCTQALIDLYDAWQVAQPASAMGYDAKAAEWRARLVELQAATQPTSEAATQPATVPAAP